MLHDNEGAPSFAESAVLVFCARSKGWAYDAVKALSVEYSTMPKGLRRFHHTGDWHFITCSCYRRRKFLDWVRRRDLFLDILEQVRDKYDFVVAGYVVMPELSLVNRGTARGQALPGHPGVEAARIAALPREEEKEGQSDEALGRRGAPGFLATSLL